MTHLKQGDKAPDFTLPTDGNGTFTLSAHKGKKIVLYFYPKDDTSGCTKQACGFRDLHTQLNKLDALVVGVSKDSVKSHDKFKAKYELNFPLVSDEDSKLMSEYGVWVEKSLYGRKYMGAERTTFIIDEEGKIAAIFPKVKVDGHMAEVTAALAA